MSKQPPNIALIQKLINQLSYDDFITMLAVLGDQHPEGTVKRVVKLRNEKYSVIYIRSFSSLEKASSVARAIDRDE